VTRQFAGRTCGRPALRILIFGWWFLNLIVSKPSRAFGHGFRSARCLSARMCGFVPTPRACVSRGKPKDELLGALSWGYPFFGRQRTGTKKFFLDSGLRRSDGFTCQVFCEISQQLRRSHHPVRVRAHNLLCLTRRPGGKGRAQARACPWQLHPTAG